MSNNVITIKTKGISNERSPIDPQECCDWANARITQDGLGFRRWVVTGDKNQPIRLERVI